MSTISKMGQAITPKLLLGYTSSTRSNNVIHQIIGRANPDVSFAPDSLRSGTLRLLFTSEADAWEAFELHSTPGVCRLYDPNVPAVNMAYVRSGELDIALDEDSRSYWILSVGYQEVAS